MTPATSARLDALFSFTEGNTWPGIAVMKWRSGIPSDDIASAVMQFRQLPKSPTFGYELSTADGTIVITDAANWILNFPGGAKPPLKAGKWYAQLLTTDVNGVETTWIFVQPEVWVNSNQA